MSEVRELFSNALRTNIEAFRLRGTQDVFPVMDFFVDPSKPKGDPDRARLQPRHEPGTKDFSATNSKDAYEYACLGFAIGEEGLAREQAAMTWDPPDADYIGPRSEVCTPNQQSLAYGLRLHLEGKVDESLVMLSRVRTLPGDYVGLQAQLLKSIVQRESNAFVRTLEALLAKHEAISKRNKLRPTYYICIPALGMTAMAIKAGIVTLQQLPRNVYLPVGMFGEN